MRPAPLQHKRRTAITLGDRLASALLSLVFAVPTCLLIMFFVNIELAHASIDHAISWSVYGWIVLGFVLCGFAFPRLIPSVFGWLWQGLSNVLRWWW